MNIQEQLTFLDQTVVLLKEFLKEEQGMNEEEYYKLKTFINKYDIVTLEKQLLYLDLIELINSPVSTKPLRDLRSNINYYHHYDYNTYFTSDDEADPDYVYDDKYDMEMD